MRHYTHVCAVIFQDSRATRIMSNQNTRTKLSSIFSQHGLRCTKQRVALYEALYNSTAHPTADELYRILNGKVPAMSLATVYNTLEAFCEAGLAHKMPGVGINGSARYDAAREDNHLHVRCRVTGAIADVPKELSNEILKSIPKKLLKKLEEQLGYAVDQVKIEMIGRNIEACEKAKQTANSKPKVLRAEEKEVCKDSPEYQKALKAAMNPRMPSPSKT